VTLKSGNATIQANFTIIQYALTVTSGGNGTTSPSIPSIVNYGVATPITATSDSNYGFVNWTVPSGSVTFGSTGTGTSTTSSDTVTLKSGDATIQANFGPTVMYNANGATSGVVPSGSAYSIGQTVTVSGNTGNLANSGYTFAGWNTAANGSGTTYSAGNTFSMPASEVTLYAVWNKQVNGGTTITQPPNYAVTINGPTTLHFGSPANFTSTYTGTPSSYAWYIDTSTTAIGTLSSLSITPTVSTYTYGAHVLTLIITDANGLSYAGSLAITVQN
jgi:uncharacterized repeat protein (TIGR02543 family)